MHLPCCVWKTHFIDSIDFDSCNLSNPPSASILSLQGRNCYTHPIWGWHHKTLFSAQWTAVYFCGKIINVICNVYLYFQRLYSQQGTSGQLYIMGIQENTERYRKVFCSIKMDLDSQVTFATWRGGHWGACPWRGGALRSMPPVHVPLLLERGWRVMTGMQKFPSLTWVI